MIRNCNYCNNSYEAEARYLNRGQGLFCSTKCSGCHKTELNKKKPYTGLIINCAMCGEPIRCDKFRLARSKSGLLFCNRTCLAAGLGDPAVEVASGPLPKDVRIFCGRGCGRVVAEGLCLFCRKQDKIERWLAGDQDVARDAGLNKNTKGFVKTYLIETRGDKCELCGFDHKAPSGRSIIQMDHIDGNYMNNHIDNLRLLCPNCHAMTETYGSKNRGNGRSRRRKDPAGLSTDREHTSVDQIV